LHDVALAAVARVAKGAVAGKQGLGRPGRIALGGFNIDATVVICAGAGAVVGEDRR
jgi:hypothetical protein